MDWLPQFASPYWVGAATLVTLIMFAASLFALLRRLWRHLFAALRQVAKKFDIDLQASLMSNGGPPLPADAVKELQSAVKELEARIELFAVMRIVTAQEYLEFGNAYHPLRQFQAAIEMYDKSLRLVEDPFVLNNRGIAYDELGQHERAIQDYDRALQLKPDYLKVLNNRGRAYLHLHKYEHAIQDFNKALQLKPDYPIARYNMAGVYSLMSKADEALKWLKEAIDLDQKYLDKAKTDSDFDNIRDDPRFKELVGE